MAGSRRSKWVKTVLWTLISLVVVFYIAGGIVFSNMIHADLLEPRGHAPDNGVYAVDLTESTITLTSAEERNDTMRPGVAGLAWEGGYGQLGEIRAVDGLDVTRGFVLIDGQIPPVCTGQLEGCDEIDIDSYSFPTDPSDVGLEFEEVAFESPLGDFGAWRIDAGDGTVWAIHAHGWRASRREALRALPTFHGAGVTSLVVDYRNDIGAPKDPGGIYHFGKTEWEDIEAAVEYARSEGAESVILVGYSTGAALHLAFLENSDQAEHVMAAVYDSPNADTAAALRLEASRRPLPGTSIPVPGSLVSAAMFFADLRWDVDWDEIAYIERANEIATVPTLVFHGTEDDRVPIGVSRRFRDAVPDQVVLVEVPDAGHVTSWNVDPLAYDSTLREFLESNIP